MPDLADLTPDAFEALVDDRFERPLDGGGALELRLRSVDRGRTGPNGRTPFSLLFEGPAHPVLDPDVHPLEHEQLGRIEVLIGPVMDPSAAPGTVSYEVVFG